MILSPMNVELTKVHYYESCRKNRNQHLMRQSEIIDNNININIKRNIFGQKSWTFNVNTQNNNKKPKKPTKLRKITIFTTLIVVVALIIASVSTAAVIYYNKFKLRQLPSAINTKTRIIVYDESKISVESVLTPLKNVTNTNLNAKISKNNSWHHCKLNEVYLRQQNGVVQCINAKDARDPSGCGGLCTVNKQHCRLLDSVHEVYECVDNKNALKCPFGYFYCGDSLCIHKKRVCDGKVDCPHMQDEKDCRKCN